MQARRIPVMQIFRIRNAVVVLSLALGGVALGAPPAAAQATRTWVSGVGDDVNPCSRTAPCKTFAGAISKTATGGVINAMDDGGFGGVTITKALTIDGGGHVASALVAGGTNGIVINAPADAQVVLRNIDIKAPNPAEGNCGGLSGVRILGAASVRLDNVSIGGFAFAVSAPLTNSSVDVFVDISINDSKIADNCQNGIQLAPDASHPGRLTLDRTTITGSNVALSVAAGGESWVSNSRFYLNNVGVQPAGGKIHSLCNNQVAGNASDGAFTDDLCGGPATTPPPTPATSAPTYCTVPKLKKKSQSQAARLLTDAGCALGKVKKQSAPASKQGEVLSQDVAAGTEVRVGTKVKVVVGK
jgi:hypothetical protein